MAGIIGLDPGPLTLRELLLMAESRSQDNWAHTSAILALVANVNRDPKKSRAFKPSDFNPHAKTSVSMKADISVLKQVFVDQPRNPRSEIRNP